MRFMGRTGFCFLWIGVVVLWGCGGPQSSEGSGQLAPSSDTIVELTAEQYQMANLKTEKIQFRTLSEGLKVNGLLEAPPQNLITVTAPMGGIVVSTNLLQGQKVKKGDVLAVMENLEYVQLQQDYLEQKSRLAFLEQEYQRQQALHQENISATKTFQQVKSEYESASIRLRGLEEKLAFIGINAHQLSEKNLSRRIMIYSPADGYVAEMNVNIGKPVQANEVMFELVDPSHIHVELMVYERDVSRLRVGQGVRFRLPNRSDTEYKASLHLIGRKINSERMVRVHAHLEQENPELLPGMYVEATVELAPRNVPTVPEEAIVTAGGKQFLFLPKGKRKKGQQEVYVFERVEVQKGITENGLCEVILPPDRRLDSVTVVTQGAFALLSTMLNVSEE